MTPQHETIDTPIDLAHGIGPIYHVNTEGFSWDFDILSYNGLPYPPPSQKYEWIYTLGMGDNKKVGNNSSEILINYMQFPRTEGEVKPTSFAATIRGHTVYDFRIPVRSGHRYSASIIASGTITSTHT
ncbi:MAG: hypothetical protein WBZ36_13370 [Candidatus Nitrosopolaris sp.]